MGKNPNIGRSLDELGITSAEFAELIGVSKHTVDSWRVGRRSPCCGLMETHVRKELKRLHLQAQKKRSARA